MYNKIRIDKSTFFKLRIYHANYDFFKRLLQMFLYNYNKNRLLTCLNYSTLIPVWPLNLYSNHLLMKCKSIHF